MKRIYTVLSAALLLAGIVAWSGCSYNEEPEVSTGGNGTTGQADSFSFRLKGTNAATRAESTLDKPLESVVKTMYVALFIENNADVKTSTLHKVYYNDAAAVEGTGESEWPEGLKMTESGGSYTITKPGYIGKYVAYFIANPDKKIKDELLKMQKNVTRIQLSAFENTLLTGDNTADGTTDDNGTAQTEENKQRGFIMLGKQNITLTQQTTLSVSLNRLATRFDIVNTAATTGEVKITKLEISQGGKSSSVAETAVTTPVERLGMLTTDLSTAWTDQTGYFTTYAYENLITDDEFNRAQLVVYYTLGTAGNVKNKKITIELKEGDNYLGVTRNHLYRIYLNGVSGDFKLEVADWNVGETVTIPNSGLSIKYTAADLGKIGDFVHTTAAGGIAFSDGGLREITVAGLVWDKNLANIKAATDRGTCVGVVFSSRVSEMDKEKGWTGYATAIKPTAPQSTGQIWTTKTGDIADIPNVKTVGEMVNDMDGYAHCQVMEKEVDAFPMYKTLKSAYASTKLPTGTSDWYMPSIGQLCDLFYNLAGFYTFRTEYQDEDIATSDDTLRSFNGYYSKINQFTINAGGTALFQKDNVQTSSESTELRIPYIHVNEAYKVRLCGHGLKNGWPCMSFGVFAFKK